MVDEPIWHEINEIDLESEIVLLSGSKLKVLQMAILCLYQMKYRDIRKDEHRTTYSGPGSGTVVTVPKDYIPNLWSRKRSRILFSNTHNVASMNKLGRVQCPGFYRCIGFYRFSYPNLEEGQANRRPILINFRYTHILRSMGNCYGNTMLNSFRQAISMINWLTMADYA